ncbi:MAG: GGDEF domain-containing protein [Spirochaetales bacterium]|nr:GGDEF domain-containing protein [Spirochaetales bacterium]
MLLFAAYRLKITIDDNREESQASLEALRIAALSIYLAEGDFDSGYFTSTMREKFRETERLLLLTIYSTGDGIHYLISSDQGYLVEAPTAQSARGWNGQPEYTARPVYENRLNLRFSPGIRQDLFIEGIFRDVDRDQLYPILREIFYILLVYLLIASVFLLFAATAGRSAEVLLPAMSGAQRTARSRRAQRPRRQVPAGAAVTAGAAGEGLPDQPGSALFSPATGLGWRQHLSQRLDSELERAAGADQDMSLLLISAGARDIGNLSRPILDFFPLRDLAFEYDSSTAAVILPDKDLDQALREAEEFRQKFPRGVCMGLSARNGRLVSSKRLLTEAGQSLRQAESAGGGIVAFRADPDKYRAAIASRAAGSGRSHRR